eukprot:5614807-Alexandrium_andersonii.AAC.1
MAIQTASTWRPAACRRSASDRMSGSTGMACRGGSSAEAGDPWSSSARGGSGSSLGSFAAGSVGWDGGAGERERETRRRGGAGGRLRVVSAE